MSRTFDALDNDTVNVVFDNLGLQACGNCRERSSDLGSLHECCDDFVKEALTLCSAKLCGTLAVLTHADAQCLWAERACSLSELRKLSGKRRQLSVT